MTMNNYDDILHLPHHVSKKHPRMSMRDRAAQFAPFSALTGFEDVIAETGRPTERAFELDEQEAAELDRRLNLLIAKLPEHPTVTITYFVPDEHKSGGKYRTVTGKVEKISAADRTIVMADGTAIPLENIAFLEIITQEDVISPDGAEAPRF